MLDCHVLDGSHLLPCAHWESFTAMCLMGVIYCNVLIGSHFAAMCSLGIKSYIHLESSSAMCSLGVGVCGVLFVVFVLFCLLLPCVC